jgi:hypothetical protein
MNRCIQSAVAIALLSCLAADTPPRAARSVHLSYELPDAAKDGVDAFYGEVTIEKSVPGSYFQVCGFNGGYFGIQQLASNKKVGIFSVWDTGNTGNDPGAVADKNRVQTLFTGDGVRASRFGGEGTGGHSDFDCDWAVGTTYRFYVTATVDGTKTNYDAWFFDPATDKWKHVATFSAPDGGKRMKGLYSFIEDFRRDTRSATEVRRATYGNAWVRTKTGDWLPLTKAKFTASGATWEAKDTIDAGTAGDQFYLQTGGDTKTTTPLKSEIERMQPKDAKQPEVPVTGATTAP